MHSLLHYFKSKKPVTGYLCKSQTFLIWLLVLDLNQRRSPFETWSPVCTTVCHALCFGTSEISLLLPQAAVDSFAVEQPNSSAETKGRWLSSMQERDTKKAYTNVYALFVAPCFEYKFLLYSFISPLVTFYRFLGVFFERVILTKDD